MPSLTLNHQRLSLAVRLNVALVSGVLLFASPSWGAFVCYDEKFYPSVIRLERTDAGFKAILGQKFLKMGEQNFPAERPILTFADKEGWKRDRAHSCGKGDWNCLPEERREQPSLPRIDLSPREARALGLDPNTAKKLEQHIRAWTQHGEFVWFGISFYSTEEEGLAVDGLARYNTRTGRSTLRRPAFLEDSLIAQILHDEKSLWIGTGGHCFEGSGTPPTHGLGHYDWNADRFDTFEGKDDGPCGFVVHDLFQEGSHLWVATDLGLSRWDRRVKKWDHYIPDPGATPPMRPTTCAALYTSLFSALPRSHDPQRELVNFYSQLFNPLKRFRPSFLKEHVKAMPGADWGCDELKFLAEGMPDFQILKAELLSVRPVGSPHFDCVLKGFAGKQSRDPEWRDLLVKVLEVFGDEQQHDRQSVVYPLLQNYPGDTQIGELLAGRLKTRTSNPWWEAELLPIFLGRKSVPPLIEALDRFQDRTHILRAIVKALRQATQVFISPNGVITPVSPSADHEKYRVSDKALSLVVAQWKKWWEIHKAEYGAEPVPKESIAPGKVTGVAALRIEPKLTLSSPSSPLPLGTASTLTATVTNVAEPSNPPLRDFSVSFRVVKGPHAGIVTPLRGVTDTNGSFTFSYSGTKSGKDTIGVSHEGEDIFMEEGYVEIAWGGPDLVVPLFVPPVLQSGGGKTMFVTDWTQNSGSFPSTPSTTRYFLSVTNPPDPTTAHVIGERTVPALAPDERNEVKQLQFVLPGDLSAGTYYLTACADADKTVLEVDEQNNCSFSRLSGQVRIIMPVVPLEKSH